MGTSSEEASEGAMSDMIMFLHVVGVGRMFRKADLPTYPAVPSAFHTGSVMVMSEGWLSLLHILNTAQAYV